MCRNIRTLHNFDPPASDEEIQASALQYVRKISGSTKPSQANAEAFDEAVEAVADVTRELLDRLVTTAPPKDREVEAAKAKARSRSALRGVAIPDTGEALALNPGPALLRATLHPGLLTAHPEPVAIRRAKAGCTAPRGAL